MIRISMMNIYICFIMMGFLLSNFVNKIRLFVLFDVIICMYYYDRLFLLDVFNV